MTMKRLFALIVATIAVLSLSATSTTYQFKSLKWVSAVGTVTTDNKTDGWISNKDASDYSSGRTDAQGRLYSCGVGVKKTTTGAGATSVIEFQNVRSVIVNYCQNSSKGVGKINITVGSNAAISYQVTRPATSGEGVYNRDVEIAVPEQSGKVKFTVDCTENGIYINTITIKADNGSPNNPSLSTSVYRIVTDASQLHDGDKVIFGVANEEFDYMMGVYDEYNSRNNIFAETAVYGTDRQTIRAKSENVYTVEVVDGKFAFLDSYNWYIVASGGNPNNGNNNYLTVWDSYESTSYGTYGLWDVTVASDGKATVESTGKSRSKYLQFNTAGANGHPIFACYSATNFTPIAIYREQEEVSDGTPIINANFVNFGTQLLTDGTVSSEKTIEVEALNLDEDISIALRDGSFFSIDKSTMTRDGDKLIGSFTATATGTWNDVLILSSGSTTCEVPVMLTVDTKRTVAQARELSDLTYCYLNDVTVTKKYDRYIFVRDETGSMMLYDNGNLYGKDLSNGYVLSGVAGYFKNYYGNPQINLGESFSSKKGEEVAPTVRRNCNFVTDDICSYVRLEHVKGSDVNVYNLFKLTNALLDADTYYNIVGIVYYYDDFCVCPITFEVSTGLTGDVNVDGIVDVADVVALANYVMGDTPSPFNIDVAEINGEEGIDVADVVALANIIMGAE